MSSKQSSSGASYRRHKDADRRVASAQRLLRALLDVKDEVHEAHLRELLSVCIWKISQAEGSSKYRTRYRSVAALEATTRDLRHDHVFERRKLVQRLLDHPGRADEIAELAVACTVTKAEHTLLTALSGRHAELDGWDRYRAVGIDVVDTATGERLAMAAVSTCAAARSLTALPSTTPSPSRSRPRARGATDSNWGGGRSR